MKKDKPDVPKRRFRPRILNFLKSWGAVFISIVLITLIVCSEVLPGTVSIEAGSPAKNDIVAHRTVVNRYATQKLQDEARRSFIKEASKSQTYYQINLAMSYQSEESVDEVMRIIQEGNTEVASFEVSDIFGRRSAINEQTDLVKDKLSEISVDYLSSNDIEILISMNQDNFLVTWQNVTNIVGDEMRQVRITEENLQEVKSSMEDRLTDGGIQQDYARILSKVASAAIVPNLSLDVALVEKSAEEQAKLVQPVYIQQDQMVIRRGEIATEEQIMVLTDLGLIKGGDNIKSRLAVLVLVIIASAFSIVYFLLLAPKDVVKPLNSTLICIVAVFTMLFAKFMMAYLPTWGIYLIPAAFPGVVIASLVSPGVALAVCISITMLIGMLTGGNFLAILLSVTGGFVGVFGSKMMMERRKMVKAVALIGASLCLVCFFYSVAFEQGINQIGLLLCLLNGIIATIISVGTLPLLEMTFGVVSEMSLLELLNSSHPLIHRMMFEAPGTYQHSVNVANMAETAAQAIGLDYLLVRVGAQYHDCGKLKRPYFFVENQMNGINPHDRMTPSLSASMIIAHVKDGVELAKQYKLPMPVIDIISQHHGRTLVSFFYHKEVEREKENGREADESKFRYPGPKPQSKEAALVMMADSCEAAVRSLSDNSPSVVRNLIHKIIWDKVMDGQLSECSLTLKDLDLIEEAFFQVLSGMHHQRIEYPAALDQKDEETEGDTGEKLALESGKKEDKGTLEGEDDN